LVRFSKLDPYCFCLLYIIDFIKAYSQYFLLQRFGSTVRQLLAR
jgi:hypothetical protein